MSVPILSRSRCAEPLLPGVSGDVDTVRNSSARLDVDHRLPLPGLGRVEYGVADGLRLQGVAERGSGRLAVVQVLEEVGDLMHKRVLIADLEARHPPVLHVRMIAIGDVDRPPAAEWAFVAVIEVLEAVQVVEVPLQRRLLAVNLEGVERLVTAGVTGRFEEAERAVLEPAEERAGVVDLHRLDLARERYACAPSRTSRSSR